MDTQDTAGSYEPTGQDKDFIEPSTYEEKALAKIWEDAVGIQGVGADAHFMDLGGNSVSLFMVLNRIEETFGVALEVELFFRPDESSLSSIAGEIARRRVSAQTDSR